ncbi:hypothetical protein [Streptomyces luteolus]|uniref:hypothetical protein n=1 Tax=Streptomyces luteolus TaxID=3043615 RepID=UPI0038D0061B
MGAGTAAGERMRPLRQRCDVGMVVRGLDTDRRAVEQLEYELGVIECLGYEAYFLAVAQVVADTRAMGVRVAARGSGAGSMVNHSLFVATANPREHRLSFERFTERRTSLPDIDLDVEYARRLDVYDAMTTSLRALDMFSVSSSDARDASFRHGFGYLAAAAYDLRQPTHQRDSVCHAGSDLGLAWPTQ